MPLLKNKTVVITRPKEQSAEFISKLEELGASPVLFPLIQIEPVNKTELLKTYSSNKFSWIIFTSYNAVRAFFDAIDPSTIIAKIAVVGSKTGVELKKLNLKVDFIPSKFTAETLAKEIPLSENDSIFIPQSALSKSNLVNILKSRKAKVISLVTYQNSKIEYSQEKLAELFNTNVDFITFTSSSTVRNFADLTINLGKIKVVCIGPETAKIAKANNIKVDGIANPYTIDGMIDVLLKTS